MKHRFIALFSLALSLAASLKAGAQVFALQYDADDGNKSVVQEYDNNGVLINPSLFTVTGATAFATSGNDLFIGSITSDNHGLISEYDSSGAVVNASLLTLSSFPQGLVISGNDLFVSTTTGTQSGAIGHYTVSGATLNSSFLGVTSTSMAISGNDLFVVDNANNRISEYTTSGQLVNASLISGLYYPTGMTISGNDLFVSNSNGTVGKYTLAGGTVNAALIQGLHSPTTLRSRAMISSSPRRQAGTEPSWSTARSASTPRKASSSIRTSP